MELAWHYKFNGGKSVAVSDEAAEVILIAEKSRWAKFSVNDASLTMEGEAAQSVVALMQRGDEAGPGRCWRVGYSGHTPGFSLEAARCSLPASTSAAGFSSATPCNFGCVHFEAKETSL